MWRLHACAVCYRSRWDICFQGVLLSRFRKFEHEGAGPMQHACWVGIGRRPRGQMCWQRLCRCVCCMVDVLLLVGWLLSMCVLCCLFTDTTCFFLFCIFHVPIFLMYLISAVKFRKCNVSILVNALHFGLEVSKHRPRFISVLSPVLGA